MEDGKWRVEVGASEVGGCEDHEGLSVVFSGMVPSSWPQIWSVPFFLLSLRV